MTDFKIPELTRLKPLPSDEFLAENISSEWRRLGWQEVRDEYAAPAYAEIERLKGELAIKTSCQNESCECDKRIKELEAKCKIYEDALNGLSHRDCVIHGQCAACVSKETLEKAKVK